MNRYRKWSALVAGLSMLAAACGGDDSGSSDNAATADTASDAVKDEVNKLDLGGTNTTAATGSTAATKPAAMPTSMEEWEALWADERAAIVKKIKDNKWGLSADGATITGPEGFTIDVSKCAAGWSNTEGISDTEVKIGSPTALSGTLADGGNINKAGQVILDYYHDKGLFKDSTGKDRKINLLIKDDGYDPARTIPLVDEALDSERVFALWTLGSPPTMKVYDKINERCVPHPFAITGHPAWGDPVNHPWTTGILLAYNTEAVLWGAFIDQRIEELTADDGKATIAALIMNNDFGKAYDVGFKSYLDSSPNKDKIEYVTELIEPQAPTVTDPMTSLAAKNPEMFIQMVAGTPCSQSFVEAAQNGMKETAKYLMAASVCKPSSQSGKDVVGDATSGWWVMGGGGRDINSPIEDDNPWIIWARDTLRAGGYDAKDSGNLGSGMSIGWDWVQALAIAGQLDGGLTRANLIVALRSMDMTHPAYLDGIKFNLNGNADAYWIEGTEVGQYDYDKQAFIQQGDIIELSGKSKNCSWDQSAGTCK